MGVLLQLIGIALLSCSVLGQQTSSAQNSTATALVYGYPLLAFEKFARQYNVSNFLYHARKLSTAEDKTVVRPNVDTLYSAVRYDLSQTDLVLQVPEIPTDQFVLFSFDDPYGDNYANFGTGVYQQSGRYLLRRPSNGSFETGLVPRDRSIVTSEFVADVFSPTYYGIIVIRWLINSTNLDAVHQLQDQTTISENKRTILGAAPTLASLNLSSVASSTTLAEQVLNLLALYSRWNQPQTAEEATYVAEQLESAGISGNQYALPENVDLNGANSSALASIAGAARNTSNISQLNNGWSITNPDVAGSFTNGTNLSVRAAVAASGYLMLQAPIAVYPSWSNSSDPGQTSSDRSFDLAPNEAWIYTFSRKPPLQTAGFWSLTAYADNYLIPNAENRYQAGDRSNLTYPDGSAVYGATASQSDGSFQILVQAADVLPPSNWTNNWVPGPAGGGSIAVLLRFYLARDDLLDGTYEYPVVERRAAITSRSNGTSEIPTSTSNAGPAPTSSASPTSTTYSGTAAASNPLESRQIVLAFVLACAAVCLSTDL